MICKAEELFYSKDTQKALEVYLKSTRKTLEGHLKGFRRALGMYLDTQGTLKGN